MADVDAELERRGGHERLQRAGLQPVLGVEPRLLRQAAVMRGDLVLAEPLAQVPRHALGHPPRVDEDQRRLVRARSARSAGRSTPPTPRAPSPRRAASAESRAPDRARGDGLRRRSRSRRVRRRRPTRKRATSSTGFCVAESPMPQQRPLRDLLQPLERQRQVRAAPRADDRVNLVDDDRADRPQQLAAALRRQQQVQRLRRGHEDVRRRAQHGGAFGLRSCRRCGRPP